MILEIYLKILLKTEESSLILLYSTIAHDNIIYQLTAVSLHMIEIMKNFFHVYLTAAVMTTTAMTVALYDNCCDDSGDNNSDGYDNDCDDSCHDVGSLHGRIGLQSLRFLEAPLRQRRWRQLSPLTCVRQVFDRWDQRAPWHVEYSRVHTAQERHLLLNTCLRTCIAYSMSHVTSRHVNIRVIDDILLSENEFRTLLTLHLGFSFSKIRIGFFYCSTYFTVNDHSHDGSYMISTICFSMRKTSIIIEDLIYRWIFLWIIIRWIYSSQEHIQILHVE